MLLFFIISNIVLQTLFQPTTSNTSKIDPRQILKYYYKAGREETKVHFLFAPSTNSNAI